MIRVWMGSFNLWVSSTSGTAGGRSVAAAVAGAGGRVVIKRLLAAASQGSLI